MVVFKQINTEETYKLRLEVLKTCEEYAYKYQGDFDKNTIHIGAFENNNLIGSLMKTSNNSFKGKQMQLRGMAIIKSSQGKSVGAELVSECILFCKSQQIGS